MSYQIQTLAISVDSLARKLARTEFEGLDGIGTIDSISPTRATEARISAADAVMLVGDASNFAENADLLATLAEAGRPTLLIVAGSAEAVSKLRDRLHVPADMVVPIPPTGLRTALRNAARDVSRALSPGRLASWRPAGPARRPAPSSNDLPPNERPIAPSPSQRSESRSSAGRGPSGTVVCIGASTGGTEALVEILSALPPTCPGIAIVQHMPAAYIDAFAARLDNASRISVRTARDGDRMEQGLALIGPGDRQMRIKSAPSGFIVELGESERVGGHCPAVDVLMSSAARALGRRGVGVLLTGMGRDGASGLLDMRRAGGRTAAQDEASSVVYGMPKAASDLGAAESILALDQIAKYVAGAVSPSN